ncbi:MAG TPA: CPBP family intramembrane glutamic endopeptidase [Polyangiaceae bacterium LLY-WYZ-14_1]|nr:CPBP family intramembrane glutamic endopeptidase [Polyangiaceae bacterium LLY-WYZ-14_1]
MARAFGNALEEIRTAWARIDRDVAAERADAATREPAGGEGPGPGAIQTLGYDRRPAIVYCVGAALLLGMETFGYAPTWRALVRAVADSREDGGLELALRFSPWSELYEFAWWTGVRAIGFFLLPLLVIKLSGARVRDQGVSMVGLRRHLPIYLWLYLAVLPLVIGVSFREDFASYYPFYQQASRSWFDLLAWELMYAFQFFCLEFFFRGWWLTFPRAALGSQAIFPMVVPYAMIHLGKPLPEALSSIVAGIVLGTLAMRTRSIWGGVFLHVAVAWTMDAAALARGPGLPTAWWPVSP